VDGSLVGLMARPFSGVLLGAAMLFIVGRVGFAILRYMRPLRPAFFTAAVPASGPVSVQPQHKNNI
jgi:hypothetical protein